jgi:hypothetical protein
MMNDLAGYAMIKRLSLLDLRLFTRQMRVVTFLLPAERCSGTASQLSSLDPTTANKVDTAAN